MAQNSRRAARPVHQGEDEEIYYGLDTSAQGGSPEDVEVTVKQGGDDVTVGVTSGDPVVTGNMIILPRIHSLTAGKVYRVEVAFTSNDNRLEPFFYIEAEE